MSQKPRNPFEEEERTVAMVQPRPSLPAKEALKGPVRAPTGEPPAPGPKTRERPAAKRSGLSARSARKGEPVRFASKFDLVDHTKRDLRLGRTMNLSAPAKPPLTRDEVTAVSKRFNGNVVPASVALSSSNLRPVEPEVASTPGARDPLLSRVVLDQFAPQNNPRYVPREAGHIFVWDFAIAMGCIVPRYRGPRELTMEQLCSWFHTLARDPQPA